MSDPNRITTHMAHTTPATQPLNRESARVGDSMTARIESNRILTSIETHLQTEQRVLDCELDVPSGEVSVVTIDTAGALREVRRISSQQALQFLTISRIPNPE